MMNKIIETKDIMSSLFTEDKNIIENNDKLIQRLEKDKWIKHFQNFPYNEEQLLFIQSPLENSKLLGIPGGGKTQSILGKILHHYNNGDFTNQNEYLILTFSRKTSYEFLEKGLKLLEVENQEYDKNMRYFNRKNIRTIHSLAGKIMIYQKDVDNQEDIDYSTNTTMEDTVILSAIFKIDSDPLYYKDMDELKELKVIFVDEAQDISNIQYDFMCCISEHYNVPIILIGDPNQNIYQFQKGSDTYLLNHSGKVYHLIKNYRSNPEIITLINYFRPWSKITPMMISGIDYTKEENIKNIIKPIIFTGTIDEIMEDINKNIKKSKFKRENMAVIGPVKKSKPYNDTYANIGLSLVINNFQNNNIEFKKQYDDSKENQMSDIEDEYFRSNKEEDKINLYTIHGSKGLEFDSVFLINFHTNTFGKVPTEEEYKEYKYLWYVGLSRAKYQLRIYVEQKKMPWYELKLCPSNYYKTENKRFNFTRTLQFKEEIEPEYFVLKNLFSNKKYFDDEVYFHLEKILPYTVKKEKIFEFGEDYDTKKIAIKDYKDNGKFYLYFLKHVYMYFFDYYKMNDNLILMKTRSLLDNLILIPKKYSKGYQEMKNRFPHIGMNLIMFRDIYENKNKLSPDEDKLLNYLYELFEGNLEKVFLLALENDVINFPRKRMEESLLFLEIHKMEFIQNKKDHEFFDIEEKEKYEYLIYKSIWDISVFLYLLEEEVNLWNIDDKSILIDLYPYIEQIIKLVKNNLNINYLFYQTKEHTKLPLLCDIDMISENDNKVIMIKFNKNVTKKYVMEIVLQSYINDNKWNNPKIEIWNFYHGEKYIIQMKEDEINKLVLLRILSLALKKKLKNMVFIYDLEIENLHKRYDIPREMVQRHMEELDLELEISSGYVYPQYTQNIENYYKKEELYKGNSIEHVKNEFENILEYCEKPLIMSHNLELYDEEIFENNNIYNENDEKVKTSKLGMIDTGEFLTNYMGKNLAKMDIIDIHEKLLKYTLEDFYCKNNVIMLRNILKYYGLNSFKINDVLTNK